MNTTEWTVPDLLQLSGGYWGTCALHAGVVLDLFTHLEEGLDAAKTAAACGTEERATAMLLDALTALGLLVKQGGVYVSTEFSAKNLSKRSPAYLGHIIRHHHHLMSGWAQLHESVRSGQPLRERVSHGDDREVRESFLMGMFNLASQLAPRIAAEVDLNGRRRLLDLGGGPGTYAIHFCLNNPELSATVYDLPTTREFAEATIARFELSERVRFASGDYHADSVPSGFDAAWLSHILHADGPGACAVILTKGVQALNPGGVLMVQEFILDDDKNGPPFPALFSLNMLIGTSCGQSYSESEISGMMAAAGLIGIHRLPLQLPNGAGILVGVKPS